MAGSEDPSENAVAINVVPLVDVIFCLCVFFMCSFKFRQVEAKFDAWLPDKGKEPDQVRPEDLLGEIRVAIDWDEATRTVTRRFGERALAGDAELETAIAGSRDAWTRKGRPDAPVTIDSDARVPWSEVTNVVNVARRAEAAKIEFAMGAPPAPRAR